MNLSAPTQIVFVIALIVAIVAVLVFLGTFSFGISSFWLMTAAYVIMVLGTLLKGL